MTKLHCEGRERRSCYLGHFVKAYITFTLGVTVTFSRAYVNVDTVSFTLTGMFVCLSKEEENR